MKKIVPLLLLIVLYGCGHESSSENSTGNGAQPVVTLVMPTSITENSAILNGSVIPNGLPTECWFEYGRDPSLAGCDNSVRQTLGSGIESQAVIYALAGLRPGTTYFYRICASNSLGTSQSSIAGFTTSLVGAPPFVSTLVATSVSATGAVVNASVTPNRLATTAWFEWGTDPALATYSMTPTQVVGSGTTSQLVSASLAGLSTGITYYCRIAAANNSGTSRGTIVIFTPGSPPTTLTVAATSVTASGATINGYVTSNGLATDAWFAWGTDPTLGTSSLTPTQAVGSGTTSQLVSDVLAGLSIGTTYYFRIFARNSSGTSWGTIVSFTVGSAPSVTTTSATSLLNGSATLNGNVIANGLPTTAWFEWGTDPALVSRSSTAAQPIGSGSTSKLVSNGLTGLTTGTTYYFRCVASNASGVSRGTIVSFVPVSAPSVTTRGVTSVTNTGGTLNASVTPNGLATTAWFEWGTDPAMSSPNSTGAQDVGSGVTPVVISQSISGLTGNATYYFRVASQNSAGTSRGRISPFCLPSSGLSQKCVTYQIDLAHSGHATFGLPLAFPGAPTWRVSLSGTVSYPLIANGKVYVLAGVADSHGAQLYALDLATGGLVWGPVAITGTYQWCGHAYDNGKVFVVNFDGLLWSFDAETGTPGWSIKLPNQYAFTAPPTAANGIIYVGGAGSGGTLYAVDEQNGGVLWMSSVRNGDKSSPSLSDDGVFVSYPCQVYKFDPFLGSLLWHYDGPCSGGGGKTSVYSSGRLYVRDTASNPDGTIFNADNGSIVGTFGGNGIVPIPAFSATAGFFQMYGTLQSVDPATMHINWSFAGDGHLVSAPIVIDQVVIVGSMSGMVYALDATSGLQVWSGSAGAAISAPDEQNALILTGFGAGEGYLVVPAGNSLTGWRIVGP